MRVLLVMIEVLLFGCGGDSPEDDFSQLPQEFGSADQAKMDAFTKKLEEMDIPFESSRVEGIEVVSWSIADDGRVRPILCQTFPLPPPAERSVAMVSEQATKALKQTMDNQGVAYEIHEFVGAEYLVFQAKDMDDVRSIFYETFGSELRQRPSLGPVSERRGCRE